MCRGPVQPGPLPQAAEEVRGEPGDLLQAPEHRQEPPGGHVPGGKSYKTFFLVTCEEA